MSAAQHTAGPWLVNPVSAWVEVPDRDAPICALLWPADLRSEDETFANARLIAAAPDMLAALRNARDDMEFWRDELKNRTWLAEANDVQNKLDAIDAAIAKATPVLSLSDSEVRS